MRGCASKTGTGRIVMIITIRQLNPPLGCFFLPFLGSSRKGMPLRPEQIQEVEFKLCNEG